MAVVRSEADTKGCMVEATLANGIKAQIPIGFSAVEQKSSPVQDAKPGVLDLPFGKLLENEKAVTVLRQIFGPVLDSPMLDSMKGMSLKKLASMGGQTIPPEAVKELEQLIE